MSKANNPALTGGTNEGKKRHCCLTCCIVCLVLMLVFVGLVIGGSAIAFNKFVSPMIGGVKFGSAVKLMSGIYSGERNRKKIVTDKYTEEDLSDFYDELNAHLFQKVRTKAELEAEYAAFTPEQRAAVLDELRANKKWNAIYESTEDKDAVGKDYYVSANRYPLTVAKILAKVDLNSLAGNGTSAEQQEALDAFLSTDPVARYAAAGDPEEETATTGEAATTGEESKSEQDMLKDLLSDLHFDFTENGLLGTFDHTKGEDYAANIESVTFEITGNQIAALVGEVVAQVLSNMDLNKTLGTADMDIDLSKIYLPDYVLIPQVIIEHKTDLPDNYTPEQLADYNKNTYVAVTLEMRFRKLLNNKDLQAAVKAKLAEMAPQAASFTGVGFGVIKSILPKTLFVTMGIYPLDPERDAYIKINNYSEKLQGELAKVINATMGGSNMFPTEGESAPTTEDGNINVMNQINGSVVKTFSSLGEQGIPLTFVDISRAEKKKTVGLRLAHVQMLLQMMNAYDPAAQDGITPYLFMTVLKCLFSNAEMVTPTEGDLDALYTEIEDKYGVQKTYWQNGGLLNMDNLANITSAIDIKDINLRENDVMRVNLLDKQLLSLFVRAKEDGTLDQFLGDSGTAAAADPESETTSVNNLISSLNMSKMEIKQKGDTTVYTLSMRATLSIVNLLGDMLKEENSILETFIDAIPQSLSFGITVYLHTNAQGNITYVGANEDGTDATGFLINAFDETYTLKVIETLSTLMRCLGGSDAFQLDGIREKVDSAFQTVFDTIRDKLYCEVGVKEGTLVLPSLYEVVRGFSKMKIDSSETLTEADLLTPGEIREVLNTMYHSTYAPVAYTGTPGDAMLADLQSKYYLATAWTADDLFGDSVDIKSKMNADSINFRDVKDGEGHVTAVGLYRDTRTLDQLKVNIAGNALANLLDKSGKLGNLTEGNTGILKGIEVVNCIYTVSGDKTYADFIFRAKLTEEAAAAGESEEAAGFSVDTLLPDDVYLTASILMNNRTGDYSAKARFSSSIIVNNNVSATDNMFRLIKVFSGESFDSTKITDQVSSAVESAFVTIEENVNLTYGTTADTAMQLENVFNTINKLSNKPTAEQKADPEFMATYVPYQSNVEDDQELMGLMREFGRDPESETAEVTLSDGVNKQSVVATVDVAAYASVFGITAAAKAPTVDDEAAFYTDLNANFYVADGKEFSTAKINTGVVVDSTIIDLKKLYEDTRAYEDLITEATDNRLAAVIDAMYHAGIEVRNGSDLIGTAKILAVHITETAIQTFVKVEMNPSSANANLLPEVIYLTTHTWLVDPDGAGTREIYETSVSINNLSKADTENLFDRLNKLSTSMSMNFSLKMADMTKPIEDNIQDVFDNKLKALGNISYQEGKLVLPTIFAYLTDGTLVDDGAGGKVYDTSKYMVDTDISGEPNYYDTHDAATDTDKTDPESLMASLREFGFAPAAITDTVDVSGGTQDVVVRIEKTFADASTKTVAAYASVFGVTSKTTAPSKNDEEAFFDAMNANYYIQTAHSLNASNLTDMNATEGMINLQALYSDNRPYAQLVTAADNKQLAAVVTAMYPTLDVKSGTDDIGSAKILAVAISATTLKTFVQVDVDPHYANADKLPAVFYLISETWLVDPDGAGPREIYETSVAVNNMAKTAQKDETAVLFNRLNSMSSNMDFDFSIKMDDIVKPVKDNLQEVFEDKIKLLGNVTFDNGHMYLPTIFAYLAEGKLVTDGSGNKTYDTTQYMKEQDGTTPTDAVDLMYRMRELGKTSSAEYSPSYTFADHMYVWQGGAPADSGTRYNGNTYTAADEADFYEQLQAYYFLKSTPTADKFKNGEGNMFNDLTSNLTATFNLNGQANGYTGAKKAYADSGLYHYNGAQYGATLTDKALGSLMNTLGGDVLTFDSTYIAGVTITSVSLYWDYAHQYLDIEISVLVETQNSTALPENFYLTTFTRRHYDGMLGDYVYQTKISLNRFGMEANFGDGDGDLDKLLYNINQLGDLNIASALNIDTVKDGVTNALRTMFETRLKDYVVPFESYNADKSGAIDFYNVYHQIVDKLGINRVDYVNADQNVQSVIYKLHNVNHYIDANGLDTFNESTWEGNNGIIYYAAAFAADKTDRKFANVVRTLINDTKDYVTNVKGIFFVGDAADDVFDDWAAIIAAGAKVELGSALFSAFDPADTYIAMTVQLDMNHGDMSSVDVAIADLLPQYIYATVVIKVDAVLGNKVVATFLNDFSREETDMLLSQVSNSGKMNVENDIEAIIGARLAGMTFSLNTDPDYTDYVGKAN